jgi:uncharacterized protein (TIGR03790 family)
MIGKISRVRCVFWTAGLFFICLLVQAAQGATADETLVVANSRIPQSEAIAKYYMKRRHIPGDHLLLTSLTKSEVMTRDAYNTRLKKPVLKKISQFKETRIAAIVLIYGVPLKIEPPALTQEMKDKLLELKRELAHLRAQESDGPELHLHIQQVRRNIEKIIGTDKRAAVDSELALVKAGDYPLSGWIPNPYFAGFQNKGLKIGKDDVLLVCRLDGPNPQLVYRLIDDSLAAEKTGLHGIAYFDARWPPPPQDEKNLKGYKLYDASLYRAAKVVAKRMPVKLEETQALFPPGSAPRAALYAGWYSLGHYIDSFTWERGAIGYHIASSECATLRNPNSNIWCVQILEHGAAATIGPVYEPYVQGFPIPEIFFAALTEGDFNLGESYLLSLPYLSWQMVLVGDPLYQPFTTRDSHERPFSQREHNK